MFYCCLLLVCLFLKLIILGDDIKLKIGFIVKKETGVLEFLFTCPSKTDTTKNKGIYRNKLLRCATGRFESPLSTYKFLQFIGLYKIKSSNSIGFPIQIEIFIDLSNELLN